MSGYFCVGIFVCIFICQCVRETCKVCLFRLPHPFELMLKIAQRRKAKTVLDFFLHTSSHMPGSVCVSFNSGQKSICPKIRKKKSSTWLSRRPRICAFNPICTENSIQVWKQRQNESLLWWNGCAVMKHTAHESWCEEHVNDLDLSHFNRKRTKNLNKKKAKRIIFYSLLYFFPLSRVAITIVTSIWD